MRGPFPDGAGGVRGSLQSGTMTPEIRQQILAQQERIRMERAQQAFEMVSLIGCENHWVSRNCIAFSQRGVMNSKDQFGQQNTFTGMQGQPRLQTLGSMQPHQPPPSSSQLSQPLLTSLISAPTLPGPTYRAVRPSQQLNHQSPDFRLVERELGHFCLRSALTIWIARLVNLCYS